jgi:hypothetical protein
MKLSQKEYEEKLNYSLLADLFAIDKKNDNEKYIAEERKYISVLSQYIKLTHPNFNEIGLEIIDTAKNCLRYYKKDSGNFLNYFNKSLKSQIQKSKAIEGIENSRGGMKLSKKDSDLESKITKYKKTDIDEKQNPVAEIKIREMLKIIDNEFQNCQERQKPMLKELLTSKICEDFSDIENYGNFSFLDIEMIKSKNYSEQKEIAEKFGVAPSSANRTLNDFLEKVKKLEGL